MFELFALKCTFLMIVVVVDSYHIVLPYTSALRSSTTSFRRGTSLVLSRTNDRKSRIVVSNCFSSELSLVACGSSLHSSTASIGHRKSSCSSRKNDRKSRNLVICQATRNPSNSGSANARTETGTEIEIDTDVKEQQQQLLLQHQQESLRLLRGIKKRALSLIFGTKTSIESAVCVETEAVRSTGMVHAQDYDGTEDIQQEDEVEQIFRFSKDGKEVRGLLPSLHRRLDRGVGCYYEATDSIVQQLLFKLAYQIHVEDACWALEACKGDLTQAYVRISTAQQIRSYGTQQVYSNKKDCSTTGVLDKQRRFERDIQNDPTLLKYASNPMEIEFASYCMTQKGRGSFRNTIKRKQTKSGMMQQHREENQLRRRRFKFLKDLKLFLAFAVVAFICRNAVRGFTGISLV